ncbi:MAG: hypothetical protein K2P99_04710 [Burkholderiales bacterium]|jgi:hypothetical protein|nr:hypothetical protein [Burkholderiales bacterium]
MAFNTKTRGVQIDNGVYERMVAVSNQINLGDNTQSLNHDDKVSSVLNNIANTYYKNYMIDNLLF